MFMKRSLKVILLAASAALFSSFVYSNYESVSATSSNGYDSLEVTVPAYAYAEANLLANGWNSGDSAWAAVLDTNWNVIGSVEIFGNDFWDDAIDLDPGDYIIEAAASGVSSAAAVELYW